MKKLLCNSALGMLTVLMSMDAVIVQSQPKVGDPCTPPVWNKGLRTTPVPNSKEWSNHDQYFYFKNCKCPYVPTRAEEQVITTSQSVTRGSGWSAGLSFQEVTAELQGNMEEQNERTGTITFTGRQVPKKQRLTRIVKNNYVRRYEQYITFDGFCNDDTNKYDSYNPHKNYAVHKRMLTRKFQTGITQGPMPCPSSQPCP